MSVHVVHIETFYFMPSLSRTYLLTHSDKTNGSELVVYKQHMSHLFALFFCVALVLKYCKLYYTLISQSINYSLQLWEYLFSGVQLKMKYDFYRCFVCSFIRKIFGVVSIQYTITKHVVNSWATWISKSKYKHIWTPAHIIWKSALGNKSKMNGQ